MTADQLTEAMLDLRRRHRARAEETDRKIARLRTLAEEMQSLGCPTHENRRIEEMRRDILDLTMGEAIVLAREFLGLDSGAAT